MSVKAIKREALIMLETEEDQFDCSGPDFRTRI